MAVSENEVNAHRVALPPVSPDVTATYGTWVGFYPNSGYEEIRVEQHGPHLVATKISGNHYVPSGSITWVVDLRTMECWGAVGNMNENRYNYIPAKLTVVGRTIKITWIVMNESVVYQPLLS